MKEADLRKERLIGLGFVLLGTSVASIGGNWAGIEVVNKIQAQQQLEILKLAPGTVFFVIGCVVAKHGGSRLQDPRH